MATDVLTRFMLNVVELGNKKSSRDKSKPQVRYLESVIGLSTLMRSLAATGDFADCLLILKESQMNLFILLATNEKEKAKVEEIYEALEIGEVHYHALRDEPILYRDKIAAGFQKRDRLPPDRLVPRDGMHNALESYSRHVNARHSTFITEEEKGLINAHVGLAAAMLRKYVQLQREVLQ